MKSDKEVVIENQVHDFIEDQKYIPDQMKIDAQTIRDYCKKTNCKVCLLRQNGLDVCRAMGIFTHPLDDPAYVASCMSVIREVMAAGDATNVGDAQ